MKKLYDREVEDMLYDAVYLEPLALNEEYARLSVDFAYWAELASDAYEEQQHAELAQKQTKAKLYIKHRVRLEGQDEKGKTTEPQVEAAVLNDLEYVAASHALVHANVKREKAKHVLEAIRIKKDMCVSIGAHQRQEMAGDPSIRAYYGAARKARLGEEG